jgi:hypothetical protein
MSLFGHAHRLGQRASQLLTTSAVLASSVAGPAGAGEIARATPASVAAISTIPLAYSSFLGGRADDDGFMAATDAAGNVYVCGWTDSIDLPVVHAEQPTSGGGRDAFVAAFTPTGSPIYITYLGGSGSDRAYYLRADAVGSVFVGGVSGSRDFPIASAIQPAFGGGTADGFLTVLDPSGQLITSSYLGGGGFDAVNLVALDPTGGVYVSGNTGSADFPVLGTTAEQPTKAGGIDSWVARLGPAARAIRWATFLGGAGIDRPYGMQSAATGAVYVSTLTTSANFPTLHAQQPVYGGAQDVTLTGYTRSGQMTWSTYYGGSGLDRTNGVDVDPAGNVYMAGRTTSTDLPTRLAYQASLRGADDGFLASVNGTTGSLRYSTYLGGTGADWFGGVVADDSGRAYVVGGATTKGLPTPGGSQTMNAGGMDAYLALFASDGRSIVYGTYLGGTWTDGIGSAELSPDGSLWLAGHTRSMSFPTASPSQPQLAGGWDAFVAAIGPVP